MRATSIITAIIALFITTVTVQASELDRAYQKEYAFLKAQKAELEKRLETNTVNHEKELETAKMKVEALQGKLLQVSSDVKSSNEKLTKLTKVLGEKEENGGLTSNVVNQARLSLEPYGVKISDSNKTTDVQKLEKAFASSTKLYGDLSALSNTKGEFYLPDGKKVEGDIVKVGNVAAYGISKKAAGALAPAGNGAYKLWNAVGSSDDAKALFAEEMRESVDIFVYENLDKEVDYIQEKGFVDTLEDGGVIGYIIFALGIFGLVLLALRVFVLSNASSNVKNIAQIVVDLSLIHISEPTRRRDSSRMPSSA